MSHFVERPVAVITGSSSGIGRQTAIEFARRGYHVVLHAVRNLSGLQQSAELIQPEKLESTAAQASVPASVDRPDGRSIRCITTDIADAAACRDFVRTAFAWKGRVDIWVNNAGVDLLTTDARALPFDRQLELLLRIDVGGTARLSRLVAQRMVHQQLSRSLPTIINIGWDQSELGMEGEPGQLFCTAKSAVTAFTKALALSVAPHVRVNCVAPGWIRTDWGEHQASSYWDRRATTESLLNRWGSAADVAAAIAWLASPQAEFVNGQVIQVNGGRRFFPGPS